MTDTAATVFSDDVDSHIDATEAIPAQLGPYRIEARLGAGGCGGVYAARHQDLGRRVALKALHMRYAHDRDMRLRFISEARAANRIRSPHVVDITDVARDQESGVCYFVMELLEGRSLADVLAQEGPLEPQRAFRLGVQICRALQATHAEHVVHRDVKPANLVLTASEDGKEHLKLVDFGIAKLLAPRPHSPVLDVTQSGTIVGTPFYMSLEQATGDELDTRSDLYTLGVVLYQMLTGTVPYDIDSPGALFREVVKDRPPRLSEWRADIPPAVDDIVHACMRAFPAQRPSSAAEVLRVLADACVVAPTAPLPLYALHAPPARSTSTLSVAASLSALPSAPVTPTTPPTRPPSPKPGPVSLPSAVRHPRRSWGLAASALLALGLGVGTVRVAFSSGPSPVSATEIAMASPTSAPIVAQPNRATNAFEAYDDSPEALLEVESEPEPDLESAEPEATEVEPGAVSTTPEASAAPVEADAKPGASNTVEPAPAEAEPAQVRAAPKAKRRRPTARPARARRSAKPAPADAKKATRAAPRPEVVTAETGLPSDLLLDPFES